MTSQQSPSPAEAKSPRPPAPTTVIALDDDLLREIFLRLHSLPTLVRAALSCRTFFHAVRSSPAFRRSFREARPPPLLGLFFDPDGPSIPAFAPLRRRSDPDLAAVVRGADFFLTHLPDDDDDAAALPEWVIYDCRDGYILLEHGSLEQYAVYNPLTRALDLIPQPPDEIFDDQNGDASCLGCYILSSQEGGEPLRLVYTCHVESRARAAVFSSESREWQILPWSEPVTPLPEDEHWLKMDVPPNLVDQDLMFKVGETKDGRPCIVCPIDFELHAWVWRAGQDGIETWIFDKKFPLETIVEVTEGTFEEHCELKVLAIIGGFVYFCTMDMLRDAIYPCWFLSLCMETGELGTLFRRRFDGHAYPYIMAWPPSLIDNKVNPQLEGA
uniref:F-box domain-containing protein n=1 Tax=Aegilops tauschii subsp. strangulata TaxID=200361 RepID=A0A453NFR1_AEGTS